MYHFCLNSKTKGPLWRDSCLVFPQRGHYFEFWLGFIQQHPVYFCSWDTEEGGEVYYDKHTMNCFDKRFIPQLCVLLLLQINSSQSFQCPGYEIPRKFRCDGINNCGDNSDEDGCPNFFAGKLLSFVIYTSMSEKKTQNLLWPFLRRKLCINTAAQGQ